MEELMIAVHNLGRFSLAIKKRLPFSLVGVAISLFIALVIHIPLGKTIVAIALTGIFIFGGFLPRSFGSGKEEEGGFGNEKHPE